MSDRVDVNRLPLWTNVPGTSKMGVTKENLSHLMDYDGNAITDADEQKIYKALATSDIFVAFDKDGNGILDEDELKPLAQLDGKNTDISLDDFRIYVAKREIEKQMPAFIEKIVHDNLGVGGNNEVTKSIDFVDLGVSNEHVLKLVILPDNKAHIIAVPYKNRAGRKRVDNAIPIAQQGQSETIGLERLAAQKGIWLQTPNTFCRWDGPKINGTIVQPSKRVDLTEDRETEKKKCSEFVFKYIKVDDNGKVIPPSGFVGKIQVREADSIEELLNEKYEDLTEASELEDAIK